MSDNEILLSSILVVVGVVIGFMMSQLAEIWKNKRRESVIKKALRTELTVVYMTLVDGGNNANHVKQERFPFITEVYDSVKIELAAMLEPTYLSNLQRTYEEIKKLNLPSKISSRGYIRGAGSTDYIYFGNTLSEVTAYVKERLKGLQCA